MQIAAPTSSSLVYPLLLTRVKALLIDVLVMLAIFTVASLTIDKVGGAPDWLRGFISIFMLFLYEPLFISLTGSTLGHKVIGIRVVQVDHHDMKINFVMASLRFIVKGLLGWISFLTVTANEHKRAIHDFVSGSVVIHDSPHAYNHL